MMRAGVCPRPTFGTTRAKGGESLKPARLVAWTLVLALALAMTAPMAMAAPVPSQTTCATAAAADEKAVAAERDMIKAKLMDFGLTEKKAADRVSLLTDEEVHAIVLDLNSVQTAGLRSGDSWDTTTVLLVVVLVVLLVH